jgi:hypothetical protein
MKINEFIQAVSKLVEEREIIDHGSIRMLYSEQAIRDIESAEGCEQVDTGTIGDAEIAEKLGTIADDSDLIANLDIDDLLRLEKEFRGVDVEDYTTPEKEDELRNLENLIAAAAEFVR